MRSYPVVSTYNETVSYLDVALTAPTAIATGLRTLYIDGVGAAEYSLDTGSTWTALPARQETIPLSGAIIVRNKSSYKLRLRVTDLTDTGLSAFDIKSSSGQAPGGVTAGAAGVTPGLKNKVNVVDDTNWDVPDLALKLAAAGGTGTSLILDGVTDIRGSEIINYVDTVSNVLLITENNRSAVAGVAGATQTFTVSAALADKQGFRWRVVNTSLTDLLTVAHPSCWSDALGANSVGFTVDPDTTVDVYVTQSNTKRIMYGEQPAPDLVLGLVGDEIGVVGASVDMRGWVVYPADANQTSVTPTTLTFTSNNSDMQHHTGQRVFVGTKSDSSSTSTERRVMGAGKLVRTADNQFTVPRVDDQGGTFTIASGMQAVFIQEQSFMNRWMHCNSIANQCKNVIDVYALGSTNVIHLYEGSYRYMKTRVNFISVYEGSWCLGNTLLNALSDMNAAISGGTPLATALANAKVAIQANCIPQLTEMWTFFTKRAKMCFVHDFPTPVTDAGAAAYDLGMYFTTIVQALIRTFKGMVRRTDEQALTVDPGTTHGDAGLTTSGGNVHPNNRKCEAAGYIDAAEWHVISPIPATSKLINNPYNRYSQNPARKQFVESGWANVATTDTKVATSGLTGSSKFTGTVWNEIGDANITGTGVTVDWSTVLRKDKLGYDQVGVVTATTATSHTLTLAYTGKAALSLIKDLLTVGKSYGGFINFWIQPSLSTLLLGYSLSIVGNTTYETSKFAYYSAALAQRGAYQEDNFTRGWNLNMQFPDWEYTVAAIDCYMELKIVWAAVAGVTRFGFGRFDWSER